MPIAFAHIRAQGAIPNIPNRANRKKKFRGKRHLPRAKLTSNALNKLKQFRRIATRYDKLGATFFAFDQDRSRANFAAIN